MQTFKLAEGRPLLPLFLFLQILGGHFGMLLMVLTICFSSRIVRLVSFVNFCITWGLFSISYVLLLYTGQINNPNPPLNMCLVQAAMVYGSAPMTGTSSMIFLLHIYIMLHRALNQGPGSPKPRMKRLHLYAIIIPPYLLYLTIFIIVMIYGSWHPDQVQRSSFYCHIQKRSIANIPPTISAIATIGAIIVEVLLGMMLYRHWKLFRGSVAKSSGLNLSLLVRAIVFTLCAVTALATCVIILTTENAPASSDIPVAALPTVAFLLFGTQPDMLRVWRLAPRPDESNTAVSRKASESKRAIISDSTESLTV